MRVRLLMGPGGSGKGPFAQRLAKKHDFYHISTGQLFRDAITEETELGLDIKALVDSGDVVDNYTVNQLVAQELFKASKENKIVVIDGYPRNRHQAMYLENLLYHANTELEFAMIIDQPLMALVERVTSRRICSSCGVLYNLQLEKNIINNTCPACGGYLVMRPEDTRSRYMKKYLEYVELTAPVIENLIDRHKVIYIQDPENVDISDWDTWKSE